ncbi:MAG: hypothetical protein F4144_06055 [Acidimicrobiaceae bacterium]|nr:hypothetical protein [Acidimicrobiaceae bacterium]MYG99011.1 hypothetical protein [Acidimicrobiaceae bacterium]
MVALETAQVLPDRLDAASGGAARERRFPVEEALAPLLPEGSIRRGAAVVVGGHGSMTLAVALAAEASRRGSWVAAVGTTDLGVAALAERGVDLGRWALVDLSERGRDRNIAADVLGAVVGGFDLVLVGRAIRVDGATARRLVARMREHGTSVICALGNASADTAAGLQPEVRLMIEQTRWTGIDNGHGRLLARQAEVAIGGRGAASRPRRIAMWLPSEDGRVACADPTQVSDFGFGRDFEDVRERRAS